MRKALIKITVVLATFIAAVLITSSLVNLDSVDMTSDMGQATLPVVTTQYNGIDINRMYGYVKDMDLSCMRDSITPLMSGRRMKLDIDTYGATVLGIAYEVRAVDSGRLIEDTTIEKFFVDARHIESDIVIKDLIENNKEYEFILKLELANGALIKYYTRIISPEEYHISDKLEYVSDFSNRTFNKAAAEELTMYLEPSSQGDNTTFGKVDIHSNFNQVTWGDLRPLKVTDPIITVKELSSMTGSFIVDYYVSTTDEEDIKYYKVKEFYRVRYSKERMYLLDYERTMDQIYVDEKTSYTDNNIMLGISSEDVAFKESDDGKNIAFVQQGRLYKYDTANNSIAYLFGFFDTFTEDMRMMNDNHKIKIMNVDEAGNILFLVYGYVNRGIHEGESGVSAYYYDAAVNTIEELAYIGSSHAPDLLIKEVEKLSYMSNDGVLYELIGKKLYGIRAESRNYEIIADNLTEGSYLISDNNRMVAWQVGKSTKDADELILMNLDTARKTPIKVLSSETITPIGFMGEDLIYGVARKSYMAKDRMGNPILPMYQVNIFNENEGKLMTYQQPDIYIYEGEVNGNLITLHRMIRDEDGNFEETTNDQIMSAEDVNATKNILSSINSERYEKLSVIKMDKNIDAQSMKHLRPKTVLYEGTREIKLKQDEDTDQYIVYGKYGADSFYAEANAALTRAYDISGIVMDEHGRYLWKKTSRSTKNQIMAITQNNASESRSSLAVCLDTMLEYEGIIRNSQYMLSQGQSVLEILKNALPDYEILDLTGCTIDMVLYYVNQDIPVLVMLENDESVLIVGFNETNLVFMDPNAEELYKIPTEEGVELIKQGGNCFITYMPMDE